MKDENRRGDCEVIQDLMSLCAAGKASRASVRLVAEHVRECPECRRRYEATMRGLPFWKRSRMRPDAGRRDPSRRYLRWSILALCALSSLICMVVNFAVERRLSWSWIVFGAMVTSSLPLLVYMQAYTNRFLKAMLCFSGLAVLLLGVIQAVLIGMGQEDIWLWRVALPVAAVWLTVFWTGILTAKLRNLNGFFCIAIILFLCMPGDIATGAIASAYTGEFFGVRWFHMVCYLVASALVGIMGILFEMRGSRSDRKGV